MDIDAAIAFADEMEEFAEAQGTEKRMTWGCAFDSYRATSAPEELRRKWTGFLTEDGA